MPENYDDGLEYMRYCATKKLEDEIKQLKHDNATKEVIIENLRNWMEACIDTSGETSYVMARDVLRIVEGEAL